MSKQHSGRWPGCSTAVVFCLVGVICLCAGIPAHGQTNISTPAYQLINQRATADQSNFYVYLDQDSGFNHGFPSGFMGTDEPTVTLNSGCVDAGATATVCSTDPTVLDRVHGTVMAINIAAQPTGNWAGIALEEPQEWLGLQYGNGYNLTGATSVTFQVRSPNGAQVQFGVGGCMTPTFTAPIATTWTTMTLALSTPTLSCTPVLSNTHLLFEVVSNDAHDPAGATVELDNIQFTPVPTSQSAALTFPVANQTFGVVPQSVAPIPSDQVLRNTTTIYESSVAEFVLLARGTPQDLVSAKLIADTFDYALHHESNGDPIPLATGGYAGLHNGYENGDIGLYNNQPPPLLGLAGNVRLAGFTDTTLCAPSGYCLVLDGATGGNNAFAIIALVDAYRQFGNVNYLNDALTIGNWIVGNLTDTTGTGYGGYYVGYGDEGVVPPKPIETGKSVENNGDIFGAFTALANVETQLGNTGAAASWTAAANVAGDFVMRMYDPTKGRFNVGTSPAGTQAGPGSCPTGPQKGNEVINVCDFLDSNTFTMLPMANAPRYKSQIDWRLPIQYSLNTYAQAVTAAGVTFDGFDLVAAPDSGPNGVAWEFTGQMVESMNYVDQLYNVTTFQSAASTYLQQIAQAQTSAPFKDGYGLVASTLQGGDTLTPVNQCLSTPYQCIAERVGLAATSWGIMAEKGLNYYNFLPYVATNPTTTALRSTPNPSLQGQTVTFTATVSSSGGTPTGTVTFYYLSTGLGTATLSGGVATFTTAALPEGTDLITASYNGGASFAGSTSSALSQSVLPAGTSTVTLSTSASPSSLGQAVTFTAEVLGWLGGTSYDPGTGSVTFYNGATALGTVSGLSWGWEAQLTTTTLPQGTDSITAVYSGNSSYSGSTSNLLSQVVTGKPSGPQGYTFSVLHAFTGAPDGSDPSTGVVMDAQGNLYGTTYTGGVNNGGAVYKVTPTGAESVLYSFPTYEWDQAGLVLDAQGNLYGATPSGGLNGDGMVFKVTPAGVGTALYNFTFAADGGMPDGSLTLDSAGNLYGVATGGGSTGAGAVFKVTPAGAESVLYNFTMGADGGMPMGGVVRDAASNLYGTTAGGGANSQGTLYKLTSAGAETTLHTFTGGTDGGRPWESLVMDSLGNLYGTATDGGNVQCVIQAYPYVGCGTVFKVSSTGTETVLHTFAGGTDGAYPMSALVMDGLGNLYGTTYRGAYGYGTVYKISSSGVETVLYSFTGGTDGAYPWATLVQDAQGNLYGTAAWNGAGGGGTVYKLTPTAATTTTTTLTSSANPSKTGVSVTFKATVTGPYGTPSGTVVFKDGTTTLGTVTLSGGVASYSTAALTKGTHTITASFTGAAGTNFAASSGSLTQTEN